MTVTGCYYFNIYEFSETSKYIQKCFSSLTALDYAKGFLNFTHLKKYLLTLNGIGFSSGMLLPHYKIQAHCGRCSLWSMYTFKEHRLYFKHSYTPFKALAGRIQ